MYVNQGMEDLSQTIHSFAIAEDHISTYNSSTCPHCPSGVQLLDPRGLIRLLIIVNVIMLLHFYHELPILRCPNALGHYTHHWQLVATVVNHLWCSMPPKIPSSMFY